MKRFYLLSIICGTIIFYMNSCKPDPPATPIRQETYYLYSDFIDYNFFNLGSSWVYEDNINNAKDTVWVTEAVRGFDTTFNNGKPQYIYEWFRVKTYSSYHKYDYYYTCHMSFGNQVRRVKVKPGQYVGEIIHFVYPVKKGMELRHSKDIATIESVFDNYNGYANTILIKHNEDITENSKETRYYLSKNYGIVRKEVGDNQVWTLTNSNIIQ